MPTEPETADTGKSDVAGAPFLFKVIYTVVVAAIVVSIATAIVHEATYIIEFVWRST